jgi:hypothetical protein
MKNKDVDLEGIIAHINGLRETVVSGVSTPVSNWQ